MEILAGHIIWEFQWRSTFLHIDVKYVVVLLAIVELFPSGADGVYNIANLLPA
jgi:hypothetical protein